MTPNSTSQPDVLVVNIDSSKNPDAVHAMAARMGSAALYLPHTDNPWVDAPAALDKFPDIRAVIYVNPDHFHEVAWMRETEHRGIEYVRCG